VADVDAQTVDRLTDQVAALNHQVAAMAQAASQIAGTLKQIQELLDGAYQHGWGPTRGM
jgi:hypothetical protein